VLSPDVITEGMIRLVVASLLALAGRIWFYRFARSGSSARTQ